MVAAEDGERIGFMKGDGMGARGEKVRMGLDA